MKKTQSTINHFAYVSEVNSFVYPEINLFTKEDIAGLNEVVTPVRFPSAGSDFDGDDECSGCPEGSDCGQCPIAWGVKGVDWN